MVKKNSGKERNIKSTFISLICYKKMYQNYQIVIFDFQMGFFFFETLFCQLLFQEMIRGALVSFINAFYTIFPESQLFRIYVNFSMFDF